MFWRLIARLVQGNRGRLMVALLAVVSGAAVISALLNVDLDASRKFTEEFRALGANLVVEPVSSGAAGSGGAPPLMPEAVLSTIQSKLEQEGLPGPRQGEPGRTDTPFAPYLFIVARTPQGAPVVVAGTWPGRMAQLAPWWKITGAGIASPDGCLVGKTAAKNLHLAAGSSLTLTSGGREASLAVAGIVEAGGDEDGQVFVNLPVAQRLAGLEGRIQLVQISAHGTRDQMDRVRRNLQEGNSGFTVRPLRQFSEAEGSLLARIQLLIFSMVLLILVLTALSVLATMAALAMDRRADVGLMKAIGGSIRRVMSLFLAEIGILGVVGGVLGYALGMILTVWMGREVFGAAIAPRLEVLPLTVALMAGVALAGALPLRLLGRVKPAVILRGEQ